MKLYCRAPFTTTGIENDTKQDFAERNPGAALRAYEFNDVVASNGSADMCPGINCAVVGSAEATL